jgi:two-component system sensor histidine kinase AlgZ
MLQPLVENAVRHGVEPSLTGGRIHIEGVSRRGQVVLTVRNSVGELPSRPGHGMALHNVRERLRLLHDVAAQCDVWREDGQFHARITLPLA